MMTLPRWLQSEYRSPVLVLLSAAASCAVVLAGAASPLRLLAAFWLVTFIPGFALVRLLQIRETVVSLTLSTASSMALAMVVALLMLYTRTWSLALGASVLAGFTLAAAGMELYLLRNRKARQLALMKQ